MAVKNQRVDKNIRSILRELPYFDFRGDLASFHGQFNNCLSSAKKSKRNLESLTGLYDLDLFNLNIGVDHNTDYSDLSTYIRSRYYSPHSFEVMKNNLTKYDIKHSFSIFHNNLRSLNRNLENLQSHLLEELDFHFDVIGVTETKITNSNSEGLIPSIPGYNFEYVPTPLSAGGVGMFIDASLDYVILEKTSTTAYQALWIEISFTNKKHIVCGIIYRQHNSPEQFQNYFTDTVEKFISSGKTLCLMGDINIDLLKSTHCQYAHDFLSTLLSCYLIPTIDKPTRVHRSSATLIDNIFVNNPEQVSLSGNIISDISDHFSQFCLIKSTKASNILKKKKVRDFSNFSAESFRDDVCQVSWNTLIENGGNDVDKLFSSFYNKLNKIVNKHAPMKVLSQRKAKQLSTPWITRGIKASIKVKNRLFATGDNTRYKLYRNKICSLIRLSKRNYYFDYFNDSIANMKKTWEGINTLLHRKTKPSKCLSAVKDPAKNNNVIRDPSCIPDIFNKHFASVGNNLASKLPSMQYSYVDFLAKSKSPQSSFYFRPVTASEVETEILSIPNKKTYGLYSCPTLLLKYVSDIVSLPLASLLNVSVSQGVYPAKLKLSKIVPVFKSGDELDANNYRPISLLSNFNRIFEKLMYSKMISFIEERELLYQAQYGFRKSHSTQHAILDIINTIQTNMDKRLFSCGIFIDLKKAFDTVNHGILLNKLEHYGFRGIINDWFSSYLNNRTQTTELKCHISNKAAITCGVPQGSVLGPLLFLLYANDIQYSSDKFNFYLFADDTNILYADKDIKSLETLVNCELRKVCNWLTANRLTLNINKSNYVIFRPYQKRLALKPKIVVYDNVLSKSVNLECKDYVKYLGVLIDCSLSWKFHIEHIVVKISRLVGIIAKLRHFVPRNTLLRIYQSLILPYISYGLTAWGLASKSYLTKILVLQKRALRFIFSAERCEHAVPLFIHADILPLNFLYFKSVCCLMHDVQNRKVPNNILNLFSDTASIHSYNTRSSSANKFYIKKSRLEIQKRAFSRVGAKIWNEMPASLRELPKKHFQAKLHSFLLDTLKKHDDYIDISQITSSLKTYK